jgi:hypothetical protein
LEEEDSQSVLTISYLINRLAGKAHWDPCDSRIVEDNVWLAEGSV